MEGGGKKEETIALIEANLNLSVASPGKKVKHPPIFQIIIASKTIKSKNSPRNSLSLPP